MSSPLRNYQQGRVELYPARVQLSPALSMRPNPPTTKEPLVPRPPTAGGSPARPGYTTANQASDEEVLVHLKAKYKAALKASSSDADRVGSAPANRYAARSPTKEGYSPTTSAASVRPSQSASPSPAGNVFGSNYVRSPYSGIRSTMRGEKDDENEEVIDLLDQLRRREFRISARNKELARLREYGSSRYASIRPPASSLTQASDNEVVLRAAQLEQRLTARVGGSNANTALIDMLPTLSPSTTPLQRQSSSTMRRTVEFGSGTPDPYASSVTHHDLLKRRSSSTKVTDASVAILSAFDNELNLDIVLPGPEDVEDSRQGDVLSHKSILKRDLFESAFSRRDQVGVMAGAPYFRMVPKFNVGGVAQAHASGIRAVLNEVRKVYDGTVVWVTLREEPVIYINGRSHIIRSSDVPTKPMKIVGITGTRIANIENKLRGEVLAEAYNNGGNVCVHKESNNGSIDMIWEAVDSNGVNTLQEVFDEFRRQGYNVAYFRQPVAQGVGPQPADFQFVMDLCFAHSHAPIIYNCQTGRGRSSLMMVITTIVKFYQYCKRDVAADVSFMHGDTQAGSFRTLQRLISLLPDGALHERRVAVLAELSDKIYSISDHVNAAFKTRSVSESAVMRLQQYAYLIAFSAFCEARLWSRSFAGNFSEWLETVPEARLVITNIVQQPRFTSASERIEVPAGEDSEVAAAIQRRRGNVLNSNMILRSRPRDLKEVSTSAIPGVIALRQLCPGIPVFSCGRATEQGRNDLLYNIRLNFPKATGIQWISIRDEPIVFINEVGYALQEYADVNTDRDLESTLHIGALKIEELEARLAEDVKDEASRNGGYIIVHVTNEAGNTDAKKIKVQKVAAPGTVMREFSQTSGISYVRMPMPTDWSAIPADFDALLQHFYNIPDTDAVVINDGAGGLRSTIVLNFVTAIRAVKSGNLRSIRTSGQLTKLLQSHVTGEAKMGTSNICYNGIEEDEKYVERHLPELQIASSICQMLAAGSLLYTTHAITELGGRGVEWNVLDALGEAIQAANAATGDEHVVLQHAALRTARKYIMLLLAVLYLDDQNGYNENLSLGKWCDRLKEISNVLERWEDRPDITLKLLAAGNIMEGHSRDGRTAARRTGDVLTANYCIKADHFPGCQKKELRPVICGGPNFRKVNMINVYGCAIPTRVGVHNILHVLGAVDSPLKAYPGESNDADMHRGYAGPQLFHKDFDHTTLPAPIKGRVLWVNLREEPIVYVGDRPFVFRDLTRPYVNVELTGIESSKVELVERMLKVDILNEAQQYDGQFMVHDEDKPGELVGIWETANDATVKTIRDVYEDVIETERARVTFLRLPVTDEQSPELKDFDSLVNTLLPEIIASRFGKDAEEGPLSMVFNCQMGRGRTTTGMVVCCMLIGRVNPEYYEALRETYPAAKLYDSDRYANGDYACITQLRSLLSDGKRSKHNVDLVLEACDRMQNLRTAINVWKVQMESTDTTEEARGRAHHHGVHYLQRYFNLIAFSSYLSEEYDPESGTLRSSFVSWMEMRPEITNIHDHAALE